MLVNYFKIAIKVLWKNKFYTFVSLFGISFTLMTLLVLTAFFHEEFGKNPPMSQKNRMIFIDQGYHKMYPTDTIYTIDSTLVEDMMVYDTLSVDTKLRDQSSSTSSSSLKYGVLEEYFSNVEGVETASFYSPNSSFELFTPTGKIAVEVSYTDANYWKVYDFPLLEGRFYNAHEVDQGQKGAVISKRLSTELFGAAAGNLGKTFELNRQTWEVIGILDIDSEKYAMMYVPFRLLPAHHFESDSYLGPFHAIFLAADGVDLLEVEGEIARITANMPQEVLEFNSFEMVALDYRHSYARSLMYHQKEKQPYKILSLGLFILLSLFILLPILNLINLNTSRILERASEIGIRKSFGASTNQILNQFLFENVLITFIGGLIALVLSYFLFDVINDSKILNGVILKVNWTVFLLGLLISLIFGIISGFIPAWRTSKISIAQALKQ